MTGMSLVAPHAGAWIEMIIQFDGGGMINVAPHAGAWIEMCIAPLYPGHCVSSLPTRERGLKPAFSAVFVRLLPVAPHAGAWIEIYAQHITNMLDRVAPHAGAWIEMSTYPWTDIWA